MAEISASLVKELRERTGAAMMDCKKALVEVGGDIEAAIEHMRKTGLAKAEKKASRVAAEGVLVLSPSSDGKKVTLLEANCETDFVAIGDDFGGFARKIAEIAREKDLDSVEALNAAEFENGVSVDDTRKALIAKIGENMAVRRFVTYTTNGAIGSYLHGKKIGVVVELDADNAELAKQIAMHIAASNPQAITVEGLDQAFVDKERRIAQEKAAQSGKPADIAAKIAEGALGKILKEVTLLGQAFIMDPSKSVEQLLKEGKANVVRFTRYELGEGIEKEESDFVAEVMAQARGQ
ncbi:MAG: translation elongation factor Ts [Cardiobacteriaceae bacterium]|nr:translation elongation factor Ts [Cardiobacteriaceae bacterium]